jgi:hypothetical protein
MGAMGATFRIVSWVPRSECTIVSFIKHVCHVHIYTIVGCAKPALQARHIGADEQNLTTSAAMRTGCSPVGDPVN